MKKNITSGIVEINEQKSMRSCPIIEETRCLRDEYSAKHKYSIHAIIEDLNQWERQGFPMPAVNQQGHFAQNKKQHADRLVNREEQARQHKTT